MGTFWLQAVLCRWSLKDTGQGGKEDRVREGERKEDIYGESIRKGLRRKGQGGRMKGVKAKEEGLGREKMLGRKGRGEQEKGIEMQYKKA